jgi:hypothetical protein
MQYETRPFRSPPGLTRKQALSSLQNSPVFPPGSIIEDFRAAANGQWVAEVRLPVKQGGPPFPPSDEGPDEEPSKPAFPDDGSDDGPDDEPSEPSDDESSESGDEGPPKPEGEKKPEGKGGTEQAILQTLQQILHALQGGAGPAGGMGGPDAAVPGPGGKSAPPKGPAGLPGAPKPPTRALRPGDAPPGSTPVGAPAFASTREAQLPGAPGVTPVPGQPSSGQCPQCGGPQPCPAHSQQAAPQAAPLAGQFAAVAGKVPTVVLSTPNDGRSIGEIVSEVREAVSPHGYQVKQAKAFPQEGKVRVLASVR